MTAKPHRRDGPDHDRGQQRSVISMRLIVSLAASALVSLSVIGVGSVAERNARETLTSEVETRLLIEAGNLAYLSSDALLDDFPELTLNPVVNEIQNKRPDLAFVTVLDHEGRIQGHQDPRRRGEPFPLLDELAHVETTLDLGAGEQFLGDDNLLVAAVDASRADGQLIGRAVVGLRREVLEAMVTRSRLQILLISSVLLFVGVLASALLMRFLLRPISVLREGLARIGRGDLDTPMEMKDRTELGLLAETVNDMAARIKESQTDLVEKERLAHEMDLARDIQLSLLPATSTRSGDFVIEGSYQAAAEVGGDYFDVFALPDDKVGFIVADVAGKGLGGCLVTSMLAVLIRSLRDGHDSPREMLIALEDGLVDQLAPGVFVTAFYGILEPQSGRLVWASAAHSPLLVYRSNTGTVEKLKTRGIPLGAVRGGVLAGTLEDHVLDLVDGDLALQYTDGLNEAPHAETQEEFGFERVIETLVDESGKGRRRVLYRLGEQISQWTGDQLQSDDLTLLAISHEGASHNAVAKRLTTCGSEEDLRANLAEASHLELPTDMGRLDVLRDWLEDLASLPELTADQLDLVETGLHELCANIIEHGYAGEPERSLDLWWLANSSDSDASGGGSHSLMEGHFLVRDRGVPFDAEGWSPPDLYDRVTRLKGRGLGLLVVDKLASDKTYLPDTAVGNLCLVRFRSLLDSEKSEEIHV